MQKLYLIASRILRFDASTISEKKDEAVWADVICRQIEGQKISRFWGTCCSLLLNLDKIKPALN